MTETQIWKTIWNDKSTLFMLLKGNGAAGKEPYNLKHRLIGCSLGTSSPQDGWYKLESKMLTAPELFPEDMLKSLKTYKTWTVKAYGCDERVLFFHLKL